MRRTLLVVVLCPRHSWNSSFLSRTRRHAMLLTCTLHCCCCRCPGRPLLEITANVADEGLILPRACKNPFSGFRSEIVVIPQGGDEAEGCCRGDIYWSA